MKTPLIMERLIHFERCGRGSRKELRAGTHTRRAAALAGRVPRVARLLALAHRFEEHLRGVVGSYRALAELGHVSRPRVSQVMSLLNLAPDLQEAILFLPRTERGRDPLQMRHLLPIAATLDWCQQRRLWDDLVRGGGGPSTRAGVE